MPYVCAQQQHNSTCFDIDAVSTLLEKFLRISLYVTDYANAKQSSIWRKI